jgi:hypothetical protein
LYIYNQKEVYLSSLPSRYVLKTIIYLLKALKMANYTASNLAIGQANLTQKFQNGEMRYREPVVWKSLLANQPLATPDYLSLRTREDRAYQVNFFNRTTRALGSARSHNPTGAKSDSTIITPSFSTKSDAFYTSIKQADRNVRTLQEMFNHELMNSVLNFTDALEDLSSEFIFNNRSGVNGVTTDGTFDATDDVFQIDEATLGNQSIEITRMVMDILKYQGMEMDVYCDSKSYRYFKFLRNQGSGNSTNTEYQFTDGLTTFYHAPAFNSEVAGLAGTYKGFWCVVPKGMHVALDWIPAQNRRGISSTLIGGEGEYGNIINPIDGANYAMFKKWEGADETANNGYTQDIKETCELSIDVAFEKAPLTTANETVIQAFALV